MTELVDGCLCEKLRDIVNSSNIFYEDPVEKKNYSAICAMMDRIDDSMGYIFSHQDIIPKTNNELLLVLNHISIVTDVIKQLFEKLGLEYDIIERDLPRYLQCICLSAPFNFCLDQIPRDDTVFEYIRSISFAHPLSTNRCYLVRQIHDDHCSPFLMLDRAVCSKGQVGIYVYSNKSDEVFPIQFPYADIISYAIERFKLIAHIIIELEARIEHKENLWKARKVNRALAPIEILKDILSIQEQRYNRTYETRELISISTCACSIASNQDSLNKVRQAINDLIPELCDAVDNMDDERFYVLVDQVVDARPKRTYELFGYHMEKIFSYLNDTASLSDRVWGLRQADEFSKEFANKWVKIDVNNMNFEEIKVLVACACYLEAQEQEGAKK